jgi:hypothetical protein
MQSTVDRALKKIENRCYGRGIDAKESREEDRKELLHRRERFGRKWGLGLGRLE